MQIKSIRVFKHFKESLYVGVERKACLFKKVLLFRPLVLLLGVVKISKVIPLQARCGPEGGVEV